MKNQLPGRTIFKARAAGWGLFATVLLVIAIVVGSRNLAHFDAALVAYTFACLFATFGIVYRYAMWLQRPPTAMYFRRGWRIFLRPQAILINTLILGRRLIMEVFLNRFILARGKRR